MCTRAEIHEEIEPIKEEVKSLRSILDSTKNRILLGLIASITLFIGAGVWIGTIQNDIKHLRETLTVRTEDRFYRQDGEILQQQINQNKEATQEIKSSLLRIEDKLDKAL